MTIQELSNKVNYPHPKGCELAAAALSRYFFNILRLSYHKIKMGEMKAAFL
jgi:hypothetical protein